MPRDQEYDFAQAKKAQALADAEALLKTPFAKPEPKVGTTGKTQAQIDALAGANSTAAMINEQYGALGIRSVVDPKTGRVVTDYSGMAKAASDKAAADAAAKAAEAAAKAAAEAAAAQAAIDAANKAKDAAALAAAQKALAEANERARLAAIAQAQAEAEANAASARGNINESGSYVTPVAGTISADTAALDYQKSQDAKAKETARQDAIAVLTARFAQYGLQSLGERIKALAIDGATEATITLALQESPEYAKRFSANATRLKNNIKVLSPSEYLNLEDGYRQIMKAYGLTQFNNDEYVSQFIANDVSATELNTRVSTAVQRIQNADPSITKTLRDYYNIQDLDLVAYILDPAKNIDKIQKQVSAAEIGSAARSQGLQLAESAASGLVAQGVTQKEAQLGYSNIAEILPTAEKLGSIYGDSYGQADAEKEVFGQLASAKRKRQDLTALEKAQFDASSGMSRTSLTGTKPAGQY
jgi:hypothetical protein